MNKYASISCTAAIIALAACGSQNAASSAAGLGSPALPAIAFDAAPATGNLPKDTIGEELPSEGVGTEKDPTWGLVGGFTQTKHAQVLAFAPGTKITIRNLSGSFPHTLDVVELAGKPPAHFPSNPTLSFNAAGNGQLGKGYASGTIEPGKSVTVTLSKPGTYLIGCAFHYSEGMQDVIRVVAKATPGPSAVR